MSCTAPSVTGTPSSKRRRYWETVPISFIPNDLDSPRPRMFDAQTPLLRCFLIISVTPLYWSNSVLRAATSSRSTASGGRISVRVRRRIGADAWVRSQVTGTLCEVGSCRCSPLNLTAKTGEPRGKLPFLRDQGKRLNYRPGRSRSPAWRNSASLFQTGNTRLPARVHARRVIKATCCIRPS